MNIRNSLIAGAVLMAAAGTAEGANSQAVTSNGSVVPQAILKSAHAVIFSAFEAARAARKALLPIGAQLLDMAKDCIREAQRLAKEKKWDQNEAKAFAGKLFKQACMQAEVEFRKEAKPDKDQKAIDFKLEMAEFLGGEDPTTKEKIRGRWPQYVTNISSAFNTVGVDIMKAKTESNLRAMTRSAKEAATAGNTGQQPENANTAEGNGVEQNQAATVVAKGSEKVKGAVLHLLNMFKNIPQEAMDKHEDKIVNMLNTCAKGISKYVPKGEDATDDEDDTELTNVPPTKTQGTGKVDQQQPAANA